MSSEIYSGAVAFKPTQDVDATNTVDVHNQPSIVIGQGGSYEKTTPCPNERLSRIILVGIKNNWADTFLSNCKLYMTHSWSDGSLHDVLLADTFDLFPNGERFVQVASYIGSVKPENRGKGIMLSMMQGGYFGYEQMPPADKRHLVTLRLEAHPNIVIEQTCVLYVDENDKLRLEKA